MSAPASGGQGGKTAARLLVNSFTVTAPLSRYVKFTLPAGISPHEKGDENRPDAIMAKSLLGDGSLPHKGIFDTGATNSVISVDLAKRLALPVLGKYDVGTAGGVVRQTVHMVNFVLPNNVICSARLVTAAPLGKIDFLLGMDIISMGNAFIINSHDFLALTFTMYSRADASPAGPPGPPARLV